MKDSRTENSVHTGLKSERDHGDLQNLLGNRENEDELGVREGEVTKQRPRSGRREDRVSYEYDGI